MNPNPIIFAVDEHDRDDLPWPVPADHWFWQTGDRWVAVVADFHDDWWEGADPEDIAARPDPWRIPIAERPPSGTLIYSSPDGSEVTEQRFSRGACKHENLIGFWTVLVSGSVNDAGEIVELETDEGGCYQQALESDGPDEVQCRDCGAVVSRKAASDDGAS